MSFSSPPTSDQPGGMSDGQARPGDQPGQTPAEAGAAREQGPPARAEPAPSGGEPAPPVAEAPRASEVDAAASEAPAETSDAAGGAVEAPAAGRRFAVALSSGKKKLLMFLLVAAIFGVVGYLIAPRSAGSASVPDEGGLAAARAEVSKARASERKLREQVAAGREELAAAKEQLEQAAASEKDAKSKVSEAEKFIARLSRDLQEAKTANEPMRKQLAAAEKEVSESKAQADQAAGRADKLQQELAAVTGQRNEHEAARQRLGAERTGLQRDLAAQRGARAELLRLLEALDLGEAPAGKEVRQPAPLPEMPVTVRELLQSMGNPTLTVQDGNQLALHWGELRSARAVDGVVVTIDGKAASRSALAAAVSVPPAVASPPAPWRVGKKGRLHYADLVAMFGRPERVAGTGRRFRAWWPIGAWARRASATVVEGIVTQFDGRQVDPGGACALVCHRPEAYRSGGSAANVQACTASARASYRYVAEVVLPARLGREAELKARDGLTLTRWTLAPFDSVGTWIAPTNTPPGSITLRAAVDCTWTAMDGTQTAQRRYVVVTLVNRAGDVRAADCAIFAGRD